MSNKSGISSEKSEVDQKYMIQILTNLLQMKGYHILKPYMTQA